MVNENRIKKLNDRVTASIRHLYDLVPGMANDDNVLVLGQHLEQLRQEKIDLQPRPEHSKLNMFEVLPVPGVAKADNN